MDKGQLREEFYKGFVEEDEDGKHIYEPGDVEGITDWWLEKVADAFEEGRTHGYEIAKMELEKKV